MNTVEFLHTQFEVSEAAASKTGRASYRPVRPDLAHILVGHHAGLDHVALADGDTPFDWRRRTTLLEESRQPLEGAQGRWKEGAYVLRYQAKHRAELQRFVIDLVEGVDPDRPMDSASAVIEYHRSLWARAGGPLSRREQLGLYGELVVLRNLIDAQGAGVLSSWEGPTGALHDFRLPGRRLEVKTTTVDAPLLEVNALNQLRPAEPPLTLVMVQLGEGPGSSLPDVVRDVRSRLQSENGAQLFTERMQRARYLEHHEPDYGTTFSEVRVRVLLIDANVPVVNEDLFSKPVPSLRSLQWTLDPRFLTFEAVTPDFWKASS